MDIRSIGNQVTGQVPGKGMKPIYKPRDAMIADGFRKGTESETLDADKMKSLKANVGKEAWGSLAMNKAICIGAVFAGIITGAAIGGPFAPALMISLGALFGGAAIAALK